MNDNEHPHKSFYAYGPMYESLAQLDTVGWFVYNVHFLKNNDNKKIDSMERNKHFMKWNVWREPREHTYIRTHSHAPSKIKCPMCNKIALCSISYLILERCSACTRITRSVPLKYSTVQMGYNVGAYRKLLCTWHGTPASNWICEGFCPIDFALTALA